MHLIQSIVFILQIASPLLKSIHFMLATMEKTQFYLWLPSNSSMDRFPDNTLTEYRVQLPQCIRLADEWEVAVTEIQYPHSWKNVHGDKWNRFYIEDGQAVKYFDLPPGHYTTVSSVIKNLNGALKDSPYEKKLWFTYDKLSRRITVHIEGGIKMFFSDLGPMLGLDYSIFYDKTTTAPREVDLDHGFHNLYVYCDIVETQFVGNAQVPLLRIVPVEGNDGERVTNTFTSPQYLPVSRKEFETIEVNIRRDSGEIVPFEAGRLLVTLHFRRASPYFH